MKVQLAALWLSVMPAAGGTIGFAGPLHRYDIGEVEFFYSYTMTTRPMAKAAAGEIDVEVSGTGHAELPFRLEVPIPILRGTTRWAGIEFTYEETGRITTTSWAPVQKDCDFGPCPAKPESDLYPYLGIYHTGFDIIGPRGLKTYGCTLSPPYGGCDAPEGWMELPPDFSSLLNDRNALEFKGFFYASFAGWDDYAYAYDAFNSRSTITLEGPLKVRMTAQFFAEYEPAPVPEPSTLLALFGLVAGMLAERATRS